MAFVLVPLLVLVVLALVVMSLYNGLVRARNACDAAWADVDVELRRRHDLVPNLVETVKGYAAHERGTLEAVTAARNAAVSTQAARAPAGELARDESALVGGLRQIFALSERYPQLKADANFRDLQAQLAETENRIESGRRDFNGLVRQFNTQAQSFPGNLVAGAFGFKARDFFELTEPEAREAPKVSFKA